MPYAKVLISGGTRGRVTASWDRQHDSGCPGKTNRIRWNGTGCRVEMRRTDGETSRNNKKRCKTMKGDET